MPEERTRRRIVLVWIGTLSGVLSGLGASIVLTQGGHVSVDAVYALPLLGVIVGAIHGLLNLTRGWSRIVSVAVAIVTLIVGGFGFTEPAAAQNRCDISVSLGNTSESLSATSQDNPLHIDLSSGSQMEFMAIAPGVSSGTVEVVVRSVEPFSFLVNPGETVVYFDSIEGEIASGTLSIEQRGGTGFVVAGPGYRSTMIPLGVVELGVLVNDTSSGVAQQVCNDSAWIRVVAKPVSNPVGLFGLGLSILGLVGFASVGLLSDLWFPEPIPTPTPEPAAPTPTQDQQPPVTTAPVSDSFIPQRGAPHAEYVKSRILDVQGNSVDIDSGLLAGRQYRLEITLHPALAVGDEDAEGYEVTISGQSTGITVAPAIRIGIAGVNLPFELPIVPDRRGRQDIVVDVTMKGHLLQTERIGMSVVDEATDAASAEGQTTRTMYSASDLSVSDLKRREARSVLIILERESDGTVDTRIRNAAGELIAKYDSSLQPAALVWAATVMRTQLQAVLEAGPGKKHNVARKELEERLIPLVKAGQQMHLALFPRRSVTKGDADAVGRLVTAHAIVQVAQVGAGLGHSTLPWHLVYDHAFLPHTERNRLCPDFPKHEIDDCPYRDNAEVFCPTGFWGYRAIVEEPLSAVDTTIPHSPYAGNGDIAVGYFDNSLSDSGRQWEAVRGLGLRRIDGYDEMRDVLERQASRIGFVYFYAHHDRDSDVGTPGIAMGKELLSSATLSTLHVTWPNRPLVFVNGCGSGDYSHTDPLSLLGDFRDIGAAGIVATECTLWDPLAGRLGEQVMASLAVGKEIGPILRDLRRSLLADHNNPIGFVYRLHGMSETTVRLGGNQPDIAVDLRTTAPAKEKQS